MIWKHNGTATLSPWHGRMIGQLSPWRQWRGSRGHPGAPARTLGRSPARSCFSALMCVRVRRRVARGDVSSAGRLLWTARQSLSATMHTDSTCVRATQCWAAGGALAPATASHHLCNLTRLKAGLRWRTAAAQTIICVETPSAQSSRACPGPAVWAAPRRGGSASATVHAVQRWVTTCSTAGNFSAAPRARTRVAASSRICVACPRHSSSTRAFVTALNVPFANTSKWACTRCASACRPW